MKKLGSLHNLFQGRKTPATTTALRDNLTYEEARELLAEPDSHKHRALAARGDVRPEMLYYLATDPSPEVRREVARNPATPHKADRILATDDEDDVRAELARKIARLLPDSDDQDQAATRECAIALLEQLANEQLPKIRRIIAEELKSSPAAPRDLIRRLAADPILEVAAPVLQYSPLLSDDDLREIIAFTKVKGALTAIARRANVSARVADGIAAALDVPAVAALLANPNADIREDTLNFIIDNAARIEDWHGPLVDRPNLSMRLMQRIAGFVASSLVDVMVKRQDLGPADAEQLLARTRERLQAETPGAEEQAQIRNTVISLFSKGAVDEKFIVEAIEKQRRDALIQALALMGDFALADVENILGSRNGRRIVAMAWRAGLSMRTAFRLQKDVAHVPHLQLVNARNGFDYPMTPAQMQALMEPYLV